MLTTERYAEIIKKSNLALKVIRSNTTRRCRFGWGGAFQAEGRHVLQKLRDGQIHGELKQRDRGTCDRLTF